MKYLKIVLPTIVILLLGIAAFASASKSACNWCHTKVTPGGVQQHLEGAMSKKGVDCSACHGTEHQKMDDSKLAKMPTPETCAGCHKNRVEQFKEGKHHPEWIGSRR